MVVLLFRNVPRSPEILFQFPDQLHAIRKYVNIRQPVITPQITLHARNSRKQIFVHFGVHQNPPLVKQLAYALHPGKRPLLRRTVYQRAHPPPRIALPVQLFADFPYRLRMKIDVLPRREMLVNHIHVIVEIHRIPVRRKRIVQPRVNRNIILPLFRHFKRLYHMHSLVEFGVNQPRPRRRKPPVPPLLRRAFVHRRGQRRNLPLRKIRIVRPLHKLIPYLAVRKFIQINALVHKRQPFQRSHRSENIPAPVKHAHATFVVYLLRRFLVKPHVIQRRPLKLLSPLVAAFKPDHRNAAEYVLHPDKIDNAAFGRILSSALHHNVVYPVPPQIGKNLFLRHVPLHLRRKRNHPSRGIRLVFSVRVNPPRDIHALRRPALRFSGAVPAEHPAITFLAFMKRNLL